MLNARIICHLPLIVPDGCEFRVGNEVRSWVEGKAWVFDDTIEHEAWNRSGEDRYVLIFDIRRPELSEEEKGWCRCALPRNRWVWRQRRFVGQLAAQRPPLFFWRAGL